MKVAVTVRTRKYPRAITSTYSVLVQPRHLHSLPSVLSARNPGGLARPDVDKPLVRGAEIIRVQIGNRSRLVTTPKMARVHTKPPKRSANWPFESALPISAAVLAPPKAPRVFELVADNAHDGARRACSKKRKRRSGRATKPWPAVAPVGFGVFVAAGGLCPAAKSPSTRRIKGVLFPRLCPPAVKEEGPLDRCPAPARRSGVG